MRWNFHSAKVKKKKKKKNTSVSLNTIGLDYPHSKMHDQYKFFFLCVPHLPTTLLLSILLSTLFSTLSTLSSSLQLPPVQFRLLTSIANLDTLRCHCKYVSGIRNISQVLCQKDESNVKKRQIHMLTSTQINISGSINCTIFGWE